jgi:hypothetical protein
MAIRDTNGHTGPDSTASAWLIITFVTMHTFVWTSGSIMILTVIFSSKVQRHPTWINLNFSGILTCFVFAFLLTTGQLYETNPEPKICMFQASGVNAVIPLFTGTMLALVLQLWFNAVFDSNSTPRRQLVSVRDRDVILIVIPYIVPLIEFFATLGYALRNPHSVVLTDSGMFCGSTNPILGKISVIYSTIIMVPTLIIQGFLLFYIYRTRGRNSHSGPVQVATVIRFGVFLIFVVVSVILSVKSLIRPGSTVVANMVELLAPVSFVFIFGLQGDFLRAWMFWHKPKVNVDSVEELP